MVLTAIVGCVLNVKKVGKTQAAQFIYTVAVRRVFKVSKTITRILTKCYTCIHVIIQTKVNKEFSFKNELSCSIVTSTFLTQVMPAN